MSTLQNSCGTWRGSRRRFARHRQAVSRGRRSGRIADPPSVPPQPAAASRDTVAGTDSQEGRPRESSRRPHRRPGPAARVRRRATRQALPGRPRGAPARAHRLCAGRPVHPGPQPGLGTAGRRGARRARRDAGGVRGRHRRRARRDRGRLRQGRRQARPRAHRGPADRLRGRLRAAAGRRGGRRRDQPPPARCGGPSTPARRRRSSASGSRISSGRPGGAASGPWICSSANWPAPAACRTASWSPCRR